MAEEEPQIQAVDESQRVEDPEKARAMAEAGNDNRSAAAESRDLARQSAETVTGNPPELYEERAQAQDAQAAEKEEQAGGLYDETSDEVHVPVNRPENDPETARLMADASDEQWTLAANLEQSGVPGSADFARTLREKGDELAEKAKADYEQEKARYEEARDYIVGRVVALAKGEIETTDPLMIMGERTTMGRNWVRVGNTSIRPPQAEELRNLVYQVLGAERPPGEEAFKRENSSNWWTAETPSKTGVNISEMRHRQTDFPKVGVGEYQGTVEEGLGGFVSLSIARGQEKAGA